MSEAALVTYFALHHGVRLRELEHHWAAMGLPVESRRTLARAFVVHVSRGVTG